MQSPAQLRIGLAGARFDRAVPRGHPTWDRLHGSYQECVNDPTQRTLQIAADIRIVLPVPLWPIRITYSTRSI
jgi:hypothetical protein